MRRYTESVDKGVEGINMYGDIFLVEVFYV